LWLVIVLLLPCTAPAADATISALGTVRVLDADNQLGRIYTDGTQRFGDAWGVGIRAGLRPWPWLLAEVEAIAANASGVDGHPPGPITSLRGQLGWWLSRGVIAGAVYVGAGVDVLDIEDGPKFRSDTDGVAHGGLALAWQFLPRWALRVDGRAVAVPGVSKEPVFEGEGTVAVAFTLWTGVQRRAPDADGDGVPDRVDRCPYEAETIDGLWDEDGCPESALSRVAPADAPPAPTVRAASAKPTKPARSVEPAAPVKGIRPAAGLAPAATTTGLPPLQVDKDSDGDGLLDLDDRCADAAEDRDGFEDADGCPEPDNDGDGVLDAADRCPMSAETRNGYLDGDGCPDVVPASLRRFAGTVAGITFERDSARIRPSSTAILKAARKTLREWPALHVEIQGHTDRSGDAAHNLALSQARADAVRQWLVRQGIAANRLRARGFGSTLPVAAGDDPASHARNRRVEFKLSNDPSKEGK